MAAGLPVVGSDWNGYKDTIEHGKTGFLSPPILLLLIFLPILQIIFVFLLPIQTIWLHIFNVSIR